ncbi:MAG: copper resistance system multicopper oxidase [Gammaproteobacteria bacterium]|nr:copper resistance system multicopper oxidase [Gammaproteobacteria bacterium]
MKRSRPRFPEKLSMPRRRFVQGLATGGALLGASRSLALVEPTLRSSAAILSGTEFDLIVAETPVNFTGKSRIATTVNGSIPAPTLHWQEGDTVTIHVTNHLREMTSIHWHGLILPFNMDGVPGISFKGIAPGETFTYRFKVQQNGTYWYHSHSGGQEMAGMYGAIIITPIGGESIQADVDLVVQLSDWTDERPMRAYDKLKTQSDYYNFTQPTLLELFRDATDNGLDSAIDKRRMWNEMRMNPTDLSDLSGHTLTFLMNGTTPAGNWSELFNPGERIRLRFINAASNTIYDVRIPNLQMAVVQTDGIDVEPVTVDEFRFGSGETYDVIIEPNDDAYTIFAESIERSGFARGTLTSRPGLTAEVPGLSPSDWLDMTDMMGAVDHSTMPGMDHSSMPATDQHEMTTDHSEHSNALAVPSTQVRHASSEFGASTDMLVDTPRTNLNDPGVGLRNNGRRVLTLADLKTLGGAVDSRPPEREVELHLTGNMERYSWSIDGLEYGESTPIHFRHGERLRVILHNDTMMTHPMHLHGMWSELENDQGEFLVRKHTILVQPAQRISFLVTADALGRWAWHCHLLFHMEAGMFRQVIVS